MLNANPFPRAEPKIALCDFLDEPPAKDVLAKVSGRQDEELRLGSARSTSITRAASAARSWSPAAKTGTARNINTVAKLAEMAGTR